MRVRFNSPWLRLAPPSIEAFAWAGTVHVRGGIVSPLVLAHEMCHLRQQRDLGHARFLLKYLWYSIFRKRHPMEDEADRYAVRHYSSSGIL